LFRMSVECRIWDDYIQHSVADVGKVGTRCWKIN
jgi:hypothetical protein